MQNQTVLITGASSGIGKAMAIVFADRGFDLILVARNTKKLRELQTQFKTGTQSIVMPCDLTKADAAQNLFKATQKRKLRVNILINNAAYGSRGHFSELEQEREAGQIHLNIRALTQLCHFFGREMAQRRSGTILNVGSIAGFLPGPSMATYYATKAYVQSFSMALREEMKNKGVQVSVLCPGRTETDFLRNAGVTTEDRSLPWLIPIDSADHVARYAIEKLFAGTPVIIPGFRNRLLVKIMQFIPAFIMRKITMRMNSQHAGK